MDGKHWECPGSQPSPRLTRHPSSVPRPPGMLQLCAASIMPLSFPIPPAPLLPLPSSWSLRRLQPSPGEPLWKWSPSWSTPVTCCSSAVGCGTMFRASTGCGTGCMPQFLPGPITGEGFHIYSYSQIRGFPEEVLEFGPSQQAGDSSMCPGEGKVVGLCLSGLPFLHCFHCGIISSSLT